MPSNKHQKYKLAYIILVQLNVLLAILVVIAVFGHFFGAPR